MTYGHAITVSTVFCFTGCGRVAVVFDDETADALCPRCYRAEQP